MDLFLKEKNILVAGGSRGIGLAIVESLLREGANVTILARSYSNLKEQNERLKKLFPDSDIDIFSIDCTQTVQWEALLTKIKKKYDGLVANVGNGKSTLKKLPDLIDSSRVWANNYLAAENTFRYMEPVLSNGASVIFISSIAGIEAGAAPLDYSVAKSAVIALSKNLSLKFAPKIRVNCISPGNILFKGGSWDLKLKKNKSEVENMIETKVPLQKFGTPEDIASLAVFLLSLKASFITGSCIVIDGGQVSRVA